MKHFSDYKGHESVILGKKKPFDNTIYSLDIETTSYLILYDKIIPASDYLSLNEKEQEDSIKQSCMYIWMFSINEDVYYGRTYKELDIFLQRLEEYVPEKKYVFIHNLTFEFQFLQGYFNFTDVLARKKRKVMSCVFESYNIECRCSYIMSNSGLAGLPEIFKLPIKKMEGDLDYTKLRNHKTTLTEKEYKYCENDCLVIYHYIKEQLNTYENVQKIPLTSTGHVRRELKKKVLEDVSYRSFLYKAINTDGHIYNLLIDAFAGGYTHANWIYTDEVLYNVKSWDFSSSYPYILVAYKFPSKEFRKCYIKKREDMSDRFAYLMVVKFTNIKSNYFNNFISQSKCRNIKKGKYDNGRIMSADELEITLTDVDFKFILDSHTCEYEILEIYYSVYNYLHKSFIDFVLDKYVLKTTYKGVPEKEVIYQKEKNKFNALYGMSVTNNIRDEVIYDSKSGWEEKELTDDDILDKLQKEKKGCFLSFAYGVWVTAHARNNLLRSIMALDEYVAYSDTDSIKVIEGYDKSYIDNYNKDVENRIKYTSELLGIPYERFEPTDVKGNKRLIGVFDSDGDYLEFITQGAKKYAYKSLDFNKKLKVYEEVIHITVAGVPKKGSVAIKSVSEFRDDLVFTHKDTNKNMIAYNDYQIRCEFTDYQGNVDKINDKTGCCVLPTTYVLGKALDYANLISDDSSKRAIYRGGNL